ncbi:F0F1 ATP synthase subunit epsilon [Phaeovulum vinaykumarii]|uniref:ATP synthase epsilon chain n=1 Tax=Phaeovulum vinaykumarii TaxID=407234 RepID=A0A1N7MV28_9RHOB|nr:F0F1 ATP synthase subunit epsilon [Phaeovulum vinaykumarii]SIS89995.1 ATP synthase F1 subcomplex epsilon subunit [Phaeovulum vinaykumarii]SOC16879.1 ATP synthase F1 subcomplex epsilon subunit [Phaeovulum vinaykumarii]
MADTMQFDLVSPERRLASVAATEVRIPGAEGDLTAMAGHAPTITTLRPGTLTVIGPEGESEYVVTTGFAEITADRVTVLAERSMLKTDLTPAIYAEMLEEARTVQQEAAQASDKSIAEVALDDAVKLLADMEALGTHMGIDPNSSNFPH